MSKKPQDGGPAFPTRATGHVEAAQGSGHDNLRLSFHGGVSLRDYFAAKALPSALAEFYQAGDAWSDHDDLARHIYSVADAVLRARETK